ncbi:MAG: hypothetical protein U1E94_01295 [Agitococcus sp.]
MSTYTANLFFTKRLKGVSTATGIAAAIVAFEASTAKATTGKQAKESAKDRKNRFLIMRS